MWHDSAITQGGQVVFQTINMLWVLLDNQSMVNIFYNPDLLSDIHKIKKNSVPIQMQGHQKWIRWDVWKIMRLCILAPMALKMLSVWQICHKSKECLLSVMRVISYAFMQRKVTFCSAAAWICCFIVWGKAQWPWPTMSSKQWPASQRDTPNVKFSNQLMPERCRIWWTTPLIQTSKTWYVAIQSIIIL